jgi:regulator of protease activity HflC (stomatin/prohibitin superfamily)
MRNLHIPRGLIIGCAPVVVIVLVALIVLPASYTRVDYGTVAAVTRFGELTGETYAPGLHWRVPFVESVVVISTQVLSYETSDEPSASNADFRDIAVPAQTVDGQQITIKYTVLFAIPAENVGRLLQQVGLTDRIVEKAVKTISRSLTRLIAQSYNAAELYSGDGIFEYQDEVATSLAAEMERYGVRLDNFLVRKIDFDADYVAAIEEQQIAQVQIETAQYQAQAAEFERDQQITLAQAEAERQQLLAETEANRQLLLAQADADGQRLLADAEAYGMSIRGQALREYPEVTQWEFIRNLQNVQWGILPGDGITPLLPLPSLGGTSP